MQKFHEYPKFKYHPEKDPVIVHSKEHEKSLGDGWHNSPADYGVETCPGPTPDPVIASKKKSHSQKPKEEAVVDVVLEPAPEGEKPRKSRGAAKA